MSDVAKASLTLQMIAGEPKRPVKTAIGRGLKRVSEFLPKDHPMSVSRAEDIWYRQARRIDAYEMAALQEAERKRKQAKAHEEVAQLGSLFIGAAEALRTKDEEYHSEDIAALVYAARALGALDRPVAAAASEGLTAPPASQDGEG